MFAMFQGIDPDPDADASRTSDARHPHGGASREYGAPLSSTGWQIDLVYDARASPSIHAKYVSLGGGSAFRRTATARARNRTALVGSVGLVSVAQDVQRRRLAQRLYLPLSRLPVRHAAGTPAPVCVGTDERRSHGQHVSRGLACALFPRDVSRAPRPGRHSRPRTLVSRPYVCVLVRQLHASQHDGRPRERASHGSGP